MSEQRIIKDRAIVADTWQLLRLEEGQDAASVSVPAGQVIVPLAVYLAQQPALASRPALGVWIAPDEDPRALQGQLERLAVVAIDFPKFTDGRGYSHAWNLRTRLGYTGELRAIGDVLRDQLFAMQRVGFNAFATRPDRPIEDALKGLTDFSEVYSASVDQRLPLFRRVTRGLAPELNDIGAGI
ncbi:DUF934 domain-containing protein [Massilia sp. TS11]|uniref:DUF934 domain-containing protein n=1 Tax=Massilia sp. TS11 TaxID=2908003 RepID=UPI001EDA1E46|nr:DUF934 domain-containing protein [Massilia sp. TS11]MCG2586204.1 DUF934 domain-containing protein [Massilia sp. TS11]